MSNESSVAKGLRLLSVGGPPANEGGCPDEPYSLDDANAGPWEFMAYCHGAAAAFGLMGMAEAIRETYLCEDCGWHLPPGKYCHCENDE